MTPISASQGAVSEGRQTDHCCDHASETSQQMNVQSRSASRLLICCHGSLISGRVSSNGAAQARRQVATNATDGGTELESAARPVCAGAATATCGNIKP